MIIYSASKVQFNNDVNLNQISDIILENMRLKSVSGGQTAEYNSWQNSLQFMRSVLDDREIPDEAEIAIEYQIPHTSKRVDFMIAGADKSNQNNVVIIELKQWDKAEKVDDAMLHSVRVFTGGAKRIVNHPSYQAFAYATFIKNSSEQVQNEKIGIHPCAYLHNCSPQNREPLDDQIYEIWRKEAPLFDKSEVLRLRNFIKDFVSKKSPGGDLLYKIDNGRIRPSKALQDCLVSMMEGNSEFMLLDDQAVAFDMCRTTMNYCLRDGKKRTIIVQGGPGTGKSVLAVNLLNAYIQQGLNAIYCTKNSAPREAYQTLLSKSDVIKKVTIKQLFKSPFGFHKNPKNFYDCIIVDEAHRLMKQMYGDFGGENQIKECINSSLLSIFFIDEDQRITTRDIGSVSEIKKWASVLGSEIVMNENTILHSQFRCNGSDEFIQFVNNILQIGEYVDIDRENMKYDFQVFDNPNELRDKLREINRINNKARMVAGYCYDWNVKNHRDDWDIYLENGFKAKWNLDGDKIWAINPKSFEEIGCIHTAQGLEFDYVGVYIGKDLQFDSAANRIVTDKTKISKDDKSSGIRTSDDDLAEKLIKNTYKTLLTRGQKGCYIYCENSDLREWIKRNIRRNSL